MSFDGAAASPCALPERAGMKRIALVVTGDEADLFSAGRAQPCDGLARRQGNSSFVCPRGRARRFSPRPASTSMTRGSLWPRAV